MDANGKISLEATIAAILIYFLGVSSNWVAKIFEAPLGAALKAGGEALIALGQMLITSARGDLVRAGELEAAGLALEADTGVMGAGAAEQEAAGGSAMFGIGKIVLGYGLKFVGTAMEWGGNGLLG